ncbi:hypothetical protein [Streptomyces thermospinosisporus]
MADCYELQLALNLPDSLPPCDLALLRWHLGEESEGGQGDGYAYEYPLLAGRGPAWRIGGVLLGELCAHERGWALTVRQEAHPDEFDGLRRLVLWLGDVPDVLVARDGAVIREVLHADRVVDSANEVISDPPV